MSVRLFGCKLGDDTMLKYISMPYAGIIYLLNIELKKIDPSESTVFHSSKAVHKNNNQTQGIHLLLVDDNPCSLHCLETIVTQMGYRYTSTNNGEHALELVKALVFDLVVTDISLPGMTGIELTIYIRYWEKTHNKIMTPIIGLTTYSLANSVTECIEAGMNSVISKPIVLQTMQKIISNLIMP